MRFDNGTIYLITYKLVNMQITKLTKEHLVSFMYYIVLNNIPEVLKLPSSYHECQRDIYLSRTLVAVDRPITR